MANIICLQKVENTQGGFDALIPNIAMNLPPDSRKAVNPDVRKQGEQVGIGSVAFGFDSTASGENSMALGKSASASGSGSMALGESASASELYSMALGKSASASESYSMALGESASASESYSMALGESASASGAHSMALGVDASASSLQSMALGETTRASGDFSIALGSGASASGVHTMALGYQSKTSVADYCIVQIGTQSGLSAVYGGASYSVRSDIRDKTDIANIDKTKALEFINKVEPIQFVRNNREKYLLEDEQNKELYNKYGMCEYDRQAHAQGTKKGTRKNVGVKAQQVYEALKETFGSDNFANIVNDNLYDIKAKGESPNVENKYTVAYESFVPFLIGAIQEQQKQISEMRTIILAFKDKL